MIIIVCSQCKEVMGEKPGGDEISHSLCPGCIADQQAVIEHARRLLAAGRAFPLSITDMTGG